MNQFVTQNLSKIYLVYIEIIIICHLNSIMMLKITLMLLLYAHNKWTLNGDGCTGACLLGSNAGVSDFAGLPKFNWHEFSKVLVFLVLC